jgi:hypothetical protein
MKSVTWEDAMNTHFFDPYHVATHEELEAIMNPIREILAQRPSRSEMRMIDAFEEFQNKFFAGQLDAKHAAIVMTDAGEKLERKKYRRTSIARVSKRVSENVNYLMKKKKVAVFNDMETSKYTSAYRIRKNRHAPTLKALIAICNELKVDLADIISKDMRGRG